MRMFAGYIGIDYSGEGEPTSRCGGLRIYSSTPDHPPVEVVSEDVPSARRWSRKGAAKWVLDRCQEAGPLLIGIDHAFSFPSSYMVRRRVTSWDAFLTDFCTHWPTQENSVESCRSGNECSGTPEELRLTERWTSSAKSVFLFDVQGSVAKSTHAGLPWIRWLRDELGSSVHLWPFDGWTPPAGRTVMAEVYPSMFRSRVAREGRTPDQQDAYAVANWMAERDGLGFLHRYFEPDLSDAERSVASLEGWILGVA